MKKENTKYEYEGYTLICIVVVILLIELIGNYCNNHAEKLRQKNWEHFENRMQQIHYMKWESE